MIEILNHWSTVWWTYISPRMLDFTIVFLLVGMIWLIIRRRTPCQFGYCLFMLALAKLILPGAISLQIEPTSNYAQNTEQIPGDWWSWYYGKSGIGTESSTENNVPANTAVQPNSDSKAISIPPATLLYSVYCAVVLILSIRLGWILFKSSRLTRKSYPVEINKFPLDLKPTAIHGEYSPHHRMALRVLGKITVCLWYLPSKNPAAHRYPYELYTQPVAMDSAA